MIAATPEQAVECWACGAPTATTDPSLGPPFLLCGACGLAFRPAGDETVSVRDVYTSDEYFETYTGAVTYHDEPQRVSEARVRARLVASAVPAPARLLEIGAASGHFLREALNAGYTGMGIEPVPEAAAEAAERSGTEVVAGFVEDVPLEPASFDVACAWHVVEHIPEPLGALGSLREALKPGGRLVLEVPNAQSVEARRHGGQWWQRQPDVHVAQYTPDAMRRLLERVGLRVVEVTTVPVAAYDMSAPRRLAREVVGGLRARTLGVTAHPWKHEQLRAIAERPA